MTMDDDGSSNIIPADTSNSSQPIQAIHPSQTDPQGYRVHGQPAIHQSIPLDRQEYNPCRNCTCWRRPQHCCHHVQSRRLDMSFHRCNTLCRSQDQSNAVSAAYSSHVSCNAIKVKIPGRIDRPELDHAICSFTYSKSPGLLSIPTLGGAIQLAYSPAV